MDYAKVKLNESLSEHFKGQKLTKNFKDEIIDNLNVSNYFEKNFYTVLKFLDNQNEKIIGISDYSEFKNKCIKAIVPSVPFDMLFTLNQDNMLSLIEHEQKLDVDEVKSALLLKHYGDDSKSIIGFDINKVDHITHIYDLDNDGVITENEYNLNEAKINYETGKLETNTLNERKIEYSELGL